MSNLLQSAPPSGGAFGDGGEGGFVDMVTICILFIYFWSRDALVLRGRAGKIRKRAKHEGTLEHLRCYHVSNNVLVWMADRTSDHEMTYGIPRN